MVNYLRSITGIKQSPKGRPDVFRKLLHENLEMRELLAGLDMPAVYGPQQPGVEVQADSQLVGIDAGVQINSQNADAVMQDFGTAEGEGELYKCRDLDVNGDSNVSPLDALIVINDINDEVSTKPSPYAVDVNGDGDVSPVDALIVINALNARGASFECLVSPGLEAHDVPPSYLLVGETGPSVFSYSITAGPNGEEVTYVGLQSNGVTPSVAMLELLVNGTLAGNLTRGGARDGDDYGIELTEPLQIPAGEQARHDFHPVVVDVSPEAARDVQFKLETLERRDAVTGEAIDMDTSLPAGPLSTVVYAGISAIRNASGPENVVPVGPTEIAYFSFAGAAQQTGHEAVLEDLHIEVDTSNLHIALESFKLYNLEEGAEIFVQPTSVHQDVETGKFSLVFNNLQDASLVTTVQSGYGIVLVLEADVLVSQVDRTRDSTLQVFADIGEQGLKWLEEAPGENVLPRFGARLEEDRVAGTQYRTPAS